MRAVLVGTVLAMGCSGRTPSTMPVHPQPTVDVDTNGEAVQVVEEHVPDDMVLVPAGSFRMGCDSSDRDCWANERPRHDVYLDTFYIDKTEVTVADYTQCRRAGSCTQPNTGHGCNWGLEHRTNHPINCVDWDQAKSFCAWVAKRLPSESEWEKAARGADGRVYPWGDQKPSCSYAIMDDGGDGCGQDHTWPVGSMTQGASPYGALDMAGNVWEWVNDWYDEDYYAASPKRNPEGPPRGSRRVFRGGGWPNGFAALRTSGRNKFKPEERFSNLGFRCARSAK